MLWVAGKSLNFLWRFESFFIWIFQQGILDQPFNSVVMWTPQRQAGIYFCICHCLLHGSSKMGKEKQQEVSWSAKIVKGHAFLMV
jgi:hypothetical protein